MNQNMNYKRTCNELGVCQARKPACDGCGHQTRKAFPFAPGVIDPGPKHPGRAWWLSDFFGALALVVMVYFIAGYLL